MDLNLQVTAARRRMRRSSVGVGGPGNQRRQHGSPWHRTEQDGNNRVEADHGRLKAWLRPMRGLKQDRNARVVIAGHAFIQNVRRGYYELAVDVPANRRVAVALDELAMTI